ncbi:hypothetical protein E2C01_064742 [Portunus trituberculatus]|uniref:Uncharacterized protein n=1 Tax=Portunus trituberculatus TaxID=210409 RepID=A0A5B7HCM1_PORTR|nr:hypothetical protein [Portunus trituberculatus]
MMRGAHGSGSLSKTSTALLGFVRGQPVGSHSQANPAPRQPVLKYSDPDSDPTDPLDQVIGFVSI